MYIADTSAWAHAGHERVRDAWAAAMRTRRVATCPVVVLELLYSARGGPELDRWAADLGQLRSIPLTRSVTNAAQQALRTLAHGGGARHRSVKLPDLLIAACAADAAVGVLHYDADFDRLAEVLPFESRWIVPRGSV